MLRGLGALLMALGMNTGEVQPIHPTPVSVWVNAVETFAHWSDQATAAIVNQPDPQADLIVRQYFQTLANQGQAASSQGLWLQVGKYPVMTHSGDVPLPAASLTKVATTLAALEIWGADHQFETILSATGPVQNGVLQGDLIVQSQGDPLFVWEEAIALGNTLQKAGIRQVAGNLLVTPAFVMNFEPSPLQSGVLLRQALDAELWPPEAAQQYTLLPPGTPQPQVSIQGSVQLISETDAQTRSSNVLVRHQSLPLSSILKAMNIYSNNEMAEQLAQLAGGPQVVARKAAEIAQVPPQEILLINGSGLGVENRISPRAVAAMFVAIQDLLKPEQLSVADLFPVAGRDGGTLDYRQLPTATTVKTGTLNTVSALAGVLPTRDRGLVWFVIQNQGSDIEGLRNQQDLLLQALTQHWGKPMILPKAITPHTMAAETDRLGAAGRNQAL